jgi:hypothetical protein
MPWTGLRKMLLRFLQDANSDRRATRTLDRRGPVQFPDRGEDVVAGDLPQVAVLR